MRSAPNRPCLADWSSCGHSVSNTPTPSGHRCTTRRCGLTGTHTEFRRDQIDAWLTTRAEQTDRLDLAIQRRTDDLYLGELALTELDPANQSVGVRIALATTEVAGKGYGTDGPGMPFRLRAAVE